jgi:hypothetical protein
MIPEQIVSGNISPINPDGKGKFFISKRKIIDVCEHLGLLFSEIPDDAWSKNGDFVSWKGFHQLPEMLQNHFLKVYSKKDYDFGIKTGEQQDNRFLIVFDCDGNNAETYKHLILDIYGNTFIRKTPSSGYHIYYESLNGHILKQNDHIDLRNYLTIKGEFLELEIKQGSFVKEVGKNRSTLLDIPIKKVDFEKIDFIKSLRDKYHGLEIIKSFTEKGFSSTHINAESLVVEDTELKRILEEKYLPRYIHSDLNGFRDNRIIPATMGFLIKNDMPIEQIKGVLEWINNVAELKKPGSKDERHYNFDEIPDRLAGSTDLRMCGFGEFIKAINDLNTINQPSDIGVTSDLGIEYIKESGKTAGKILEEVFEELIPGNGKLATMLWAGGVATVKGDPNIEALLGNPGEGKTVAMEHILRFIPENYIIRLNDVTIPALMTDTHEKGSNYLDKKIVYLGDLGATTAWEDSAHARKVLRILLTDGRWSRKKHIKIDIGEKVSKDAVIHEELTGKPAMWFTTVREDGDDQDKDRSIIATLNMDKERDIIYLITHMNKKSRTGDKLRNLLNEFTPIIQSIFQMLVECDEEVIIPWDISELEFKFRDSARIVSLTCMLALINKEHRKQYGSYILPDDEDLIDVLSFLDKGTSSLNERVMKRLLQIWGEFRGGLFTRKDVMVLPGMQDVYSRDDKMYTKVLRPAIKAGILRENTGDRTYTYEFEMKPTNQPTKRDVPSHDYDMLEYEYGDCEIKDYEYLPNLPNGEGIIIQSPQPLRSMESA